MDAKLKAKELVDKFDGNKKYALIAVQEIIENIKGVFYSYGIGFIGTSEARNNIEKWATYQYLQKVKEEITTL